MDSAFYPVNAAGPILPGCRRPAALLLGEVRLKLLAANVQGRTGAGDQGNWPDRRFSLLIRVDTII